MLAATAAVGAGLISGLSSGISNWIARREEREAIKKQNRLLDKSAKSIASRGLYDQMRMNQSSAGQMGMLMYKNKLNPDVLRTFQEMYQNRVGTGAQMRSTALGQAAQILSQKRAAPTQAGWNDFFAGLTNGIGSGVSVAAKTYNMLNYPQDETTVNNKAVFEPGYDSSKLQW